MAAARAEAYPGSGVATGTGEEVERLVFAMETVDACKARETTISGMARCLPEIRRACPERSRRSADATDSRFTHELCRKRPTTPITTKVLLAAPCLKTRRTHEGKAPSSVPLPRGRGGPRHTNHYEINFASANAAAAATPPIAMVCSALRPGPAPVYRPFRYPKSPSAARVTIAEYASPCAALESRT